VGFPLTEISQAHFISKGILMVMVKYIFSVILLKLKKMYDIVLWDFLSKKSPIKFKRAILGFWAKEPWAEQIENWQYREQTGCKFIPYLKNYYDLDVAEKIHNECLQQFTYVKDIEQYNQSEVWSTTPEIELKMKGDCDDFAMLVWKKLRLAGFDPSYLGMVIISGHMFACIHVTDTDFYVLDNGNITYNIRLASRVLPHKGREPICGFNVNQYWVYRKNM
jgi:hypothetical protein